jgi:hypothetical protein
MHKSIEVTCKIQLPAGQCRNIIEGGFELPVSVLTNAAAAVAPDDAVEGSKNAIDCAW